MHVRLPQFELFADHLFLLTLKCLTPTQSTHTKTHTTQNTVQIASRPFTTYLVKLFVDTYLRHVTIFFQQYNFKQFSSQTKQHPWFVTAHAVAWLVALSFGTATPRNRAQLEEAQFFVRECQKKPSTSATYSQYRSSANL